MDTGVVTRVAHFEAESVYKRFVSAEARPVLKRYAPLAVVLGVQLLLVAVLPSTAAKRSDGTSVALAPGQDAQAGDQAVGAGPGSDAAAAAGASTGGAAAATGTSAGAAGTSSGGGQGTANGPAASGGAGGVAASGDTTHCVQGRNFDPAIDYFAPPCVARSDGKNPGATYGGVTGNTIKVVDYFAQGNAAVDDITKTQGLYVSIDQQRAWVKGVEQFINTHYELYGRKVSIEVVQGGCSTIPPDTTCLRNEMRQIVAEKHPFVFKWNTPLTSAPFDELSALKVLNVGGLMFTDGFSQARRPYHWDVHESGTKIADAFGEMWCKQLKGRNAEYSNAPGPPGTPGNTNGKPRILGIIGTNDPENIKMREEVDRVLHTCGDRVYHTYDASNDLSTAAAQKSASVANMRQSPEATTVLCLCNPVGAEFVYEEMQQQNYYPENLFAGTVYIDTDDTGQSFMGGGGCPSGSQCEFTKAWGLASQEPREPVGKDAASRVWKAAGMTGAPPFDGAQLDWEYYELIASMLQGGGPNLTPQSVEQGAFGAGFRGGGTTGHILRGFSPGNYAWNQDMAVVYWDPKKQSSFNGKAGALVQVGPRLKLGEYPTAPFPIPLDR